MRPSQIVQEEMDSWIALMEKFEDDDRSAYGIRCAVLALWKVRSKIEKEERQ